MADSIALDDLQSKKCKTIVEKDRISDLPDEVLLNIVARLTLKEAIATSTLSKRWTDVWTSYPVLDFGMFHSIYDINVLVNRVKKIMEKFNGGKLHRFRIVHRMPKRLRSEINEWISFAIRNHVSELELNLRCGIGVNYCVPLHLFAREEMISNQSSPNVVSNFASLTDLRLTSVDFSDQVFDMILCNCSSLETFFVKRNHKLVNAKNTTPHLKLELLKICLCFSLEKLELLAPNLVSFNYTGQQRSLCINDAQQLVCMRLVATSPENDWNAIYPRRKDFIINQFSSYLPMLEDLFVSVALFEDMIDFTELCVFSNLKTLSLDNSSSIQLSCQVAAFIISAAPYLELLELEFKSDSSLWKMEKLELPSMSTHKNLKEVNISGFKADVNAMDLLVYLIKRSVSLQKIELTGIYTLPGDSDDANEYVQRLRDMLNTNVQLIFHDNDISDPGAICVIQWW